MPITRTTWTDDDGTGTTGTILNNAVLQAIYQAIEDAFTWTAVSFNAGFFTASGSMTWTVGAGDQTTFEYIKVGKTMTVRFCIETTTVGGTPSTGLNILIPGGFTASEQTVASIAVVDNGTGKAGFAQINASSTTIRCLLDTIGNWSASTNLTSVQGQITFETTA